MAFADKTLTCRECGATFVFTAGEQEFYLSRGLRNVPGRCPQCRSLRRQGKTGPRTTYKITCATCGQEAEVPFQPRYDRPVYCDACFAKSRQAEAGAPGAGALGASAPGAGAPGVQGIQP